MVEQIRASFSTLGICPGDEVGFQVSIYNRTVNCRKINFSGEMGSLVKKAPPELVFSEKGINGRTFIRVNEAFSQLPNEERQCIFDFVAGRIDVDPGRVMLDAPLDYLGLIGREIQEAFKKKESSNSPK